MTQKTISSSLKDRFNKAEGARSNYNSVYEDISTYINPNRDDFISKTVPGKRRFNKVYDTTGIDANRSLASALTNSITNPQSRWVSMVSRDKKLMELESVRSYLALIEEEVLSTFNSVTSSFYQQNHQIMLDLPAYGTAAMFIEDNDDGIVFTAVPLSQIFVEENSKGSIDTVYRKFVYTNRQILQQWGDNIEGQLKKDLADDLMGTKEIIHAVMPSKDFEFTTGTPAPDGKAFVSSYFIKDSETVLDIGSFHEQPYVIPRWEKLTGETYGRGSGWNAISDILMLNVMSESKVRTVQMNATPAFMVPDDGVVTSVRSVPGGITVGGVDEDGRPRVLPLPISGQLNDLREEMQVRRESVRKAFFVDRFERKPGTPVTATENVDNQQVRLVLAAPQIFRLEVEYLNPIIDRVFSIKVRNGDIPPAPPELEDKDFDYEYQSPIIKAQRNQELQAFNLAIQSLAPLIQIDPSLLDVFNGDSLMRDNSNISGIPPRHMRPEEEVVKIRAARAQAQAQEAQKQNAMDAADSAAKLQQSGIDVT